MVVANSPTADVTTGKRWAEDGKPSFYTLYITIGCVTRHTLLFLIPREPRLLYHLINVGEVAALVVVVETIAYDEVVLDVEAAVVNLEVYLQATGLHEQ